MTEMEKQMTEVSRLFDENDKIYHRIARHYQLPDSLYWVFYALYDAEEPISQVDLCNDRFYSKQTVNTSITAMVKKGWVTLEGIPGGGKRKSIQLTDSGRQLCAQVIGETKQIEKTAFQKFEPEERGQLISLLQKMNRLMWEEYGKQTGGNRT